MIALAKTKAAPGADLLRMDAPRIGRDELLIRVHRASICGSDMPIYHWCSWAPKRVRLPMVFGHEFCGEVAEAGSATRDFKRGDFVSVESHVYCGLCRQCRNGQRHVCENLRIIGVDGPGGFSEYARVPARCAWKHKDRSLAKLGSIFEPLGNAIYAALVEDVVGKSVLVTGCGPQGLFAIAAARAGGARRIVAVESSAFRRKLAERMGADAVVDPGKGGALAAVSAALDGDKAADVVLEMSGAPPAIELALKAVRSGGRLTAFGIPPKRLPVDWAEDVVFKGIRIYGIAGREVFQTWYKMDALLRSKAIDVSPVVTHRFKLKDYRKAFAVMGSKSKNCGKVVLEIAP